MMNEQVMRVNQAPPMQAARRPLVQERPPPPPNPVPICEL